MSDSEDMQLSELIKSINIKMSLPLDEHQIRAWMEILGGGLIWPGPPWVIGPCDRCGSVVGPFYEARVICLKWRGIGSGGLCDFDTPLCRGCRDVHERETDQQYLEYIQARRLRARWN